MDGEPGKEARWIFTFVMCEVYAHFHCAIVVAHRSVRKAACVVSIDSLCPGGLDVEQRRKQFTRVALKEIIAHL